MSGNIRNFSKEKETVAEMCPAMLLLVESLLGMHWSAFDQFVFPVTSNSPEVFVKVNSSQFSSHLLSGKFIENL